MSKEFLQVTAQVFKQGETYPMSFLECGRLWVVGDQSFDDVGLALDAAHTPIVEKSEHPFFLGIGEIDKKIKEATLQNQIVSLELANFGESVGDHCGIIDANLEGESLSDMFKEDAVELSKIALSQLVDFNAGRKNTFEFDRVSFIAVYDTGYEANNDWESGYTEYDPWWVLLGRLNIDTLAIEKSNP